MFNEIQCFLTSSFLSFFGLLFFRFLTIRRLRVTWKGLSKDDQARSPSPSIGGAYSHPQNKNFLYKKE